MSLIGRFKTLAQQETPTERNKRMLPGIMYGLIIASTYAFVGSIVNQLSFPDLPVGVNWRSLFFTWLFFAVWLGFGGGFINWFTQAEESVVTGWLVMIVIALGAGSLTLEGSLPTQFGKIVLLVLPVLAISLLMTITLRWLGERHAETLENRQTLRTRGIAILVAIALAIGGLTGLGLNRWTGSTQRAVRDIHSRLQTTAADPAQVEEFFPPTGVPQLNSHLGKPYTLHGHPSGQSVVAIEVSIDFMDGYHVTCILLVFPDKPPFLRACAEGDEVILPGNQ